MKDAGGYNLILVLFSTIVLGAMEGVTFEGNKTPTFHVRKNIKS